MVNTEFVKKWIALAEDDLRLAEHSSKTMWPVPVELICYHCQQSAEKYLKAFLALHGESPPLIHDLIELSKQCANINPQFSELLQYVTLLTGFGVQPRYPMEMDLDEADMNRALKSANKVRQFFKKEVPEFFYTP